MNYDFYRIIYAYFKDDFSMEFSNITYTAQKSFRSVVVPTVMSVNVMIL